MLDHMIILFLVSWGSSILFSTVTAPIHILSNDVLGDLFLHILDKASDPITSWHIDGETIETVRNFIFLGSKITAHGDCSHEIKRFFLLGRKAMTNLDSIWKSRDITLPTKFHIVKAVVFPVVMYRCESWTIKRAESWIIDAFELWCWRRHLRVPWTARRSNQSTKGNQSQNTHWKDLY